MSMIHPYSRKLDSLELIEHFMSVVLKHDESGNNKVLNKIRLGEADLKNYDQTMSTLAGFSQRHREYARDTDRWMLRKTIVRELTEKTRGKEDEDIVLGIGGALPNSVLQSNRQVILIIGLPASGKSGIASRIADEYGAVVLDSDYAKRKLPEFVDNPAGASLVHDESDSITFTYDKKDKPDDFKTVFEICIENGYNIVIPKIGHDYKSIDSLTSSLNKIGYQTHLILVSLDRRIATIRAIDRYLKTDRYIPLSLIFDGYGNDPILTFYRLLNRIGLEESFIETFGKLSTDVKKGDPPKVIYAEERSPVCIFI